MTDTRTYRLYRRGKNHYQLHLLDTVEASSPEDAVQTYIEDNIGDGKGGLDMNWPKNVDEPKIIESTDVRIDDEYVDVPTNTADFLVVAESNITGFNVYED